MSAAVVEDDIYAGYNDYPSVYSIKDLEEDELFQEVIKTSYGRRSIVSIAISRRISMRGAAETSISSILYCIRRYLL